MSVYFSIGQIPGIGFPGGPEGDGLSIFCGSGCFTGVNGLLGAGVLGVGVVAGPGGATAGAASITLSDIITSLT